MAETFGPLADADAATAEAMIIDQLAGKTYTQVLRLAEQAALTVDPALAERRREHAQQNSARVSFFREQAGTAGDLRPRPAPREALAAMAAVNARAEEYKESGAFGDTPMDVLRAYAYLDLLNGLPAAGRIAAAEAQDDAADAAEALARARPGPTPRRQGRRASQGRPRPGPPRRRARRDGTRQTRPGDPPPERPDAGPEGGDVPADPDACSCTECDGSCLAGDYDLDLDDSDERRRRTRRRRTRRRRTRTAAVTPRRRRS